MRIKPQTKLPLKWIFSGCQRFLRIFGFQLTRLSFLKDIDHLRSNKHLVNLLVSIPPIATSKVIQLCSRSQSQFYQDLFVLWVLDFRTEGYFVEFGATDGRILSNTYLLEKEFAWTGILSEPAQVWQDDLLKNRSAEIDLRCVWNISGSQLEFSETSNYEFSTIKAFSDTDLNSFFRKRQKTYFVESISLSDLLTTHKAPRIIDYLSIDTEGSEYEILKDFDFDSYSFRVITCEHNFTENRARIRNLLSAQGYTEVFINSWRVEDWYVRRDLIPENVGKFLFNNIMP